MPQLVLTAVGLDRPGLVDDLTGLLRDAGLNVADSRMVNLRGQFALLMLAETQVVDLEALSGRLVAAGRDVGLTLSVSAPAARAEGHRPGVPYRLRTFAMDQPGLVHEVTHLLREHDANIEELDTRLEPGSCSGTPLFTMHLRMTLPAHVAVNALRARVAALCDKLNCDYELSPGE